MLSLYLLRSFRRRPFRHISLTWLMLCAFLLPLVVSIYRDSLVYGVKLQDYDFHRGQAVHITGALPEDAAWFQDIQGLTAPEYEDGTIYLTYASGEDESRFQDAHEMLALSNLLKSRARQSERSLEVMLFDLGTDNLKDPYMQGILRNMELMNLALLLFSGLIVQAAYRSHIASFAKELGDLSAMGAERGQIIGMFLAELLLLFPLSCTGALGVSYGVMGLLFENYLGNRAASAAIWRVFHMDVKNTALQILFYLLVCLGAMGFALLKKPTQPKTLPAAKEDSLSRLWMRRTRAPFLTCLIILIPPVTAFLVLFNQYLGTYAKTVYSSQNAQIIVQSFTGKGFPQEIVDALSQIPGVTRVEPTWDFSEPFLLGMPDHHSMMVSVHPEEELPAGSPKLGKNQFATDDPEAPEGAYTLSRISSPGNQVSAVLAGRIEAENREQSEIHVYVSMELLRELAQIDGYTKLIVHTAAAQAAAVENQLRSRFPEAANIFNYQNYVDTTMRQQEGNLWLLSWIFCILMIAALQIVWAYLSRYVRDCAPMLRIVQQVGASRRQLSRLIPVRWGAVPGAVLPFLIALPWAWLDAARHDRPLIVSVPVLGIYLAVLMLAASAFWLPVKVTLRKIIRKEQPNGSV